MISGNKLKLEDTVCEKPRKLQGDLIATPTHVIYITFRKGDTTLFLLFMNIIWFAVRSHKMNNWRDTWRKKDPLQAAQEVPDSWSFPVTELKQISRKFPATITMELLDGTKYVLTPPMWKQLIDFAKTHGWPVV
jgi:hypothetical protein